MNTTNERFGSKRSTTIMVAVPQRQFAKTVAHLKLCLMDAEALKTPLPIVAGLIDFQHYQVVGVLGTIDISGYARNFLSFLAYIERCKSYSVICEEWPKRRLCITLRSRIGNYTLIYGYGETREKQKTRTYTCQFWGNGIE